MKKSVVALALLGAACNQEPQVDARNASVEEVAEQVAEAAGDQANFIRPGRWVSTMTLEEISAPGVPAEITERMKSTMGGGQTGESCLKPEDVEKPGEDFFAGDSNQCRYDHFKMGDGKIDARMTCTEGGASQVMEMDGRYSPDSYEMRMATKMAGAGPQGGMTMRMKVAAKRVGECTAATT